MSPEQLAGKKVDGRSDLYSLGVMLFQMLAGLLPFRGESMAELMYKIANEEAQDVRTVRTDLPEALANIVALALSKRPETRYQTGDQFALELRGLVEQFPHGVALVPASKAGDVVLEDRAAQKTVAFDATVPSAQPLDSGPDTTDIEI
jgi:serine/threonine-protein kinase